MNAISSQTTTTKDVMQQPLDPTPQQQETNAVTTSSLPEQNPLRNRSSSISSSSSLNAAASILLAGREGTGAAEAAACLPLSNDARLEFITSYTLTSLRLKHDKWHKMMATQEYQVHKNMKH